MLMILLRISMPMVKGNPFARSGIWEHILILNMVGDMPLWEAVCEVHDKFNQQALDEAYASVSGAKFLIMHPESPLPVLHGAGLYWLNQSDA